MVDIMIPGLHQPFTKADVKEATTRYNNLPRIHPEMDVDLNHVKELVNIIVQHNQVGIFGFHLVHRHDPIANGTIRLESDLGVIPGKWNKPTLIDSLDLSNMHGNIFQFDPEQAQLLPIEFGDGPPPITAADIPTEFISDFTAYLAKNSLTNIFALEIVHPVDGSRQCTAEIEVDGLGTVVLPKSMVRAKGFLPTGWPGQHQPSDGDPPAGQSWAKKVDESHKVFINKDIGTAGELVDELTLMGVIAA